MDLSFTPEEEAFRSEVQQFLRDELPARLSCKVRDGLRLTRDMPRNSEGDAGVFSSDTARKEAAVLKIENLTNEAWPVHLLDQVPYSEQDDLKITYTATEAPDETDPEGQRGLLGWHFDLEPGATREIGLEVDMRWPAGLELR